MTTINDLWNAITLERGKAARLMSSPSAETLDAYYTAKDETNRIFGEAQKQC